MTNNLEIEYFGGAGQVTGSSMLVSHERSKGPDTHILLDCGSVMGKKQPETYLHNISPLVTHDGSRIAHQLNSIVLSHAHMDHSGRLPVLIRHGFDGKIFTTYETARLLEPMLLDTAKINAAEYAKIKRNLTSLNKETKPRYQRGKGRMDIIKEKRQIRMQNPDKPNLYPISIEEVETVLDSLRIIDPNTYTKIGKYFRFKLLNAGHIMGSTMTLLETGKGKDVKRILNTHDVGNEKKNSYLGQPDIPEEPLDLIAIEATYGNREHKDLETAKSEIKTKIIQTLQNGGRVIVPAFALERTQEFLMYLETIIHEVNKTLGKTIPIYLDSRLGQNITNIYKELLTDEPYAERFETDPLTILKYKKFTLLNETNRLQELYSGKNEPAIIVSSSGMCNAGPVREHLLHTLEDRRNLVLFIGYTGTATVANRILSVSEAETYGCVYINGEQVNIKAQTHYTCAFSSHADKHQLTRLISRVSYNGPNRGQLKVLIQHCDPEVGVSFRNHILNIIPDLEAINVHVAKTGIVYTV